MGAQIIIMQGEGIDKKVCCELLRFIKALPSNSELFIIHTTKVAFKKDKYNMKAITKYIEDNYNIKVQEGFLNIFEGVNRLSPICTAIKLFKHMKSSGVVYFSLNIPFYIVEKLDSNIVIKNRVYPLLEDTDYFFQINEGKILTDYNRIPQEILLFVNDNCK